MRRFTETILGLRRGWVHAEIAALVVTASVLLSRALVLCGAPVARATGRRSSRSHCWAARSCSSSGS